MPRSYKLCLEAAAFLVGGFFFIWILRHFGFAAIGSVLSGAGPAVFLVFLFYPFMALWDTSALRRCFPRGLSSRLHYKDLYFIRLAGEALNNLTPFIDIGGEPLKVHLLKSHFHVPSSSGTSATVVARTSILLSEAVFLFAGVAMSLTLMPLETAERLELGATSLAICAAFVAFLVAQQKQWLKDLNPEIFHYYLTERVRFAEAVFLNGMGWLLGGVETFFYCRLLGVDVSMIQAVMLESLLQLVRTASFFIPGNLGAQEGGMAFFIARLGFDPVAGVSVSLLKRFRQLVWTAVGFAAWAVYRKER